MNGSNRKRRLFLYDGRSNEIKMEVKKIDIKIWVNQVYGHICSPFIWAAFTMVKLIYFGNIDKLYMRKEMGG